MQGELVHVINTQPRIFHLPPEQVLEEVKDGAGNVSKRHRQVGQVHQINPSAPREEDGRMQATAIPAKDWERAAKHPQVRGWLMKGWLKVSEGADEETGETEIPQSLMAYGVNTALTLIEGEEDRKLLAEWLKADAREEVQDAIKKRLVSLQATKK